MKKGSIPPYNLALHKLVLEKNARSDPVDEQSQAKGFLGWHQRGYLPHRDVLGATQFVTIRLHDSMPANRVSEWEYLLKIEDNRERRKRLEDYLDYGSGECRLRHPEIAKLTEKALMFFNGQRYFLHAWVIMPNHVHLLIQIHQVPLSEILQSLKRYTSREANKFLGRLGPFWQKEYWDTVMRDELQCQKAVRYIENNPVKARLVEASNQWLWSSTRFRDKDNPLRMPERSADL